METTKIKVQDLNPGDRVLSKNNTWIEVHEACPLDLGKGPHFFASLQQHINASREDLYFTQLGPLQACIILPKDQEVTIQIN